MRKHTFEYVKQYFEEEKCELLENIYINSYIKMKYVCECGDINDITFKKFQQGQRCRKCRNKKIREKLKFTLEYVEQYFKDYDCILLSKEYINAHQKLDYICSCGNISEISFDSFKLGNRCKKCGWKKIAKKLKFTLKYAKQCFKNEGCDLLEKNYINNYTKMKYRCNCGDISEIKFNNFQEGQRCKKCGIKKITGQNNWNYNPSLTDEDRVDRRKINGYNVWVKNTYQKNNYTCQKCKKRKYNNKYKKLNAHHIEGYAENPNLRLDLNNGITFCFTCHSKFHSIYGKKNVNRQQIEEFLTA